MENLKDKILLNIHKGMENRLLSNDELVQIIESTGSFLNLMTISDYAKKNNISYNGYHNKMKSFLYDIVSSFYFINIINYKSPVSV